VRFGLLETIREYCPGALREQGEEVQARRAHAAYFLELAEQAESEMYSASLRRWLDRLEAEHANLRAAFDTFAESGDAASELRLGAALIEFWWLRGHLREGIVHLRGALDRGRDAPARVRARAASVLTGQYLWTGDLAHAGPVSVDGLTWSRAAGDPVVTAMALWHRALVVGWGEEPARLRESMTYLEEGIALIAEHDPVPWVLTSLLQKLGNVLGRLGEPERGLARIEHGITLARAIGYPFSIGTGLWDLGLASLQEGDLPSAARQFGEALGVLRELQDPMTIDAPLVGVAVIAAACGRFEVAGRLLGAVAAIQERTGLVDTPWEQPLWEQAERAIRAALGDGGFVAAAGAGQARSLAESVAEAIAVAEVLVVDAASVTGPPAGVVRSVSPEPTTASVVDRFALSSREQEILGLLVQRRTDKEIAEALFISPRTVMGHAASIFTKLGVANRREAAAIAARHGLA
jgi:DNA-binding CsgD family transcriptional regulator